MIVFTVFEGVAWAVEELEQVEVILEVYQGCNLFGTEGRVALVDDGFQVFGGDFVA